MEQFIGQRSMERYFIIKSTAHSWLWTTHRPSPPTLSLVTAFHFLPSVIRRGSPANKQTSPCITAQSLCLHSTAVYFLSFSKDWFLLFIYTATGSDHPAITAAWHPTIKTECSATYTRYPHVLIAVSESSFCSLVVGLLRNAATHLTDIYIYMYIYSSEWRGT